MNAKCEAQFRSDIPDERWLQELRADVEQSGRNAFGVPKDFGKVTGRFDRDLDLPVALLNGLPGERGEQNAVRAESLAYLRANWDEARKEPLLVEVDPFGKPWVREGSHRIMIAGEKGDTTLPTTVTYSSGGERFATGMWRPEVLVQMDADSEDRDVWQLSVNNFLGEHINAIYEGLLKVTDAGPFDGACVLFAQALQYRLGGEIWTLVGKNGAEHAVLKVGDVFVDASGGASLDEKVKQFNTSELRDVQVETARVLTDDDLPDSPRNAAAAEEIGRMLGDDESLYLRARIVYSKNRPRVKP